MEIVVLANPEGRVIGHELQVIGAGGEFILAADGTIVYRSPYDDKTWHVAPSIELFQRSAESWRHYGELVKKSRSENEAVQAAAQLRIDLESLGLLRTDGPSFWSSIIEQTEHGLL